MSLRIKILLAASLLAFSSQAQASRYAWCSVSRFLGGDKYIVYLSGIVEIEEGTEAYLAFRDGPFRNEFDHYVRTSLDPGIRGTDCSSANSLREAKQEIKTTIFAMSHWTYQQTGWTGGRPQAVDGGESSTRPKSGIIIGSGSGSDGDRTPGNSLAASRQRASDEEARLEQVRERAAHKAKVAAEAAKANAEMKARLEKMLEERRKSYCHRPSVKGEKGACAQ